MARTLTKNKTSKLTKREKKFVEVKAETGNGTKAIQAAFPEIESYDAQRQRATYLLTKPHIKQAIEEALSDEFLLQVHKEGLRATKLSGTGGMKMSIDSDGEVEEFGHSNLETPDYATRHKYLDTAYKLKGLYAPEKTQNVNLNIEATISDPKIEAARKIFDETYRQRILEDIQEKGA